MASMFIHVKYDTQLITGKKRATLQNKHTSPTFETIKRLIKQKTQKKFSQKAIASANKTQLQNNKSTWENNKNKPRKQAVAYFRLNTGHDCLAAHLHRVKTSTTTTAQYANWRTQ
jgi:hypothetical protein